MTVIQLATCAVHSNWHLSNASVLETLTKIRLVILWSCECGSHRNFDVYTNWKSLTLVVKSSAVKGLRYLFLLRRCVVHMLTEAWNANEMSRAAPAVRCRTCCPVVLVEDKCRYENFSVRSGFNRNLDFIKIIRSTTPVLILWRRNWAVSQNWYLHFLAKMGNLNSAAKMRNLNSAAKMGNLNNVVKMGNFNTVAKVWNLNSAVKNGELEQRCQNGELEQCRQNGELDLHVGYSDRRRSLRFTLAL